MRNRPAQRRLKTVLSLGVLSAAPAWSQEAPGPQQEWETPVLGQVTVVGKKASLASIQKTKQEKLEIVDSVAAEDIQKLPDINVTDALSRITGIQVDRDRGEGLSVAIRGLTQVETTVNGREVFTAGIFGASADGLGRILNFADIPADMLAAIDVYKTSSADRLEGGVAGSVDLRMRRPFDFKERQVTASIRTLHGDLIGKSQPQVSLLFSDRVKAKDAGEFGFLVNLVHQKRAWREDQTGIGGVTSALFNGQNVLAPTGYTQSVLMGERERIGVSSTLQWRPNDQLDLYAELNCAQFKTRENGYQTFLPVTTPSSASASNVVLSSDGSYANSVTWSPVAIQTAGRARDTVDRTTQLAVGGSWKDDSLTLKADLSHSRSYNNLAFTSINNIGTANALTVNWGTASAVASNPSFTSVGATYVSRPFDGQLTALQIDAEYRMRGDWLDALATGMRYARRAAADASGQISKSANSLPGASAWLTATGYSDYPIGDPDAARNNRDAIASALQVSDSNPLGTWAIEENTLSTYVMGKIKSRAVPLDGNLGVRIVTTREDVQGYVGQAGGSISPLNTQSRYTDLLPSINMRYEWDDHLYLRMAASKTLTRPDFNKLSPSLTLNPAQPNNGAANFAGNPSLKPVRADNLDFAVERYLSSTTSIHATTFFKKVDGFVLTSTSPESYGGVTYQVSRPYNAKSADIKGLELGYQQFYDFLPGWMRGLGSQANYTYVDSSTLDTVLGTRVPLQNLSRHSYNLIGIYELGKVSARLAYNWRSRFLNGVTTVPNLNPLPVYTKAYGWLDASFSYRLNEKASVSVEGLNLLRTVRTSYFGVESRPQTRWVNDRQIGITVSVGF